MKPDAPPPHLPLALLTGAALFLELALIRTLSVALWYPVAYLCLGTAMLGFGAAAVLLTLSTRARQLDTTIALRLGGLGFTGSTILGYLVWNALPVDPMSLGLEPLQYLLVPILVVLITLPFAFAGFFVTTIFARWPNHAPKLYAADLFGASIGVVAYVIALPKLGGPGCIVLAGGVGLASTLYIETQQRVRVALAVAATACFALSPMIEQLVSLRITPNKLLGTEAAQTLPRGSRWTVSSTVDVIPWKDGYSLVIDGGTAMTAAPAGDRRKEIVKPAGLRAAPFALGKRESVLVIGSGGGVEVRAALGAGAKRILALEIDKAITELVTGLLHTKLGELFSYPEVELVTAEARSYLAAHDEKFDAIMAFHTISNAASSTGAMSLAESYLLTREAIELMLSRLSDDGVLIITRPEAQLPRLISTLASVWKAPTDLTKHVAVLTENAIRPDFLAALIVAKRPLDARDEIHLKEVTTGRIAYLPSGAGDSTDVVLAASGYPTNPERSNKALAIASRGLPYKPISLEPTTDDRPFFNLSRPWTDISSSDVWRILSAGSRTRARLEDLPVAQIAVLLLLLEVLILGALFIIPPVRALRRLEVPHLGATAIYFSALGFGFITVEVGLIQRLTQILGDPGWSLVSVLGVLLSTTGIGSAWLVGARRWGPRRAALSAMIAALAVAFLVPEVVHYASSATFAWRLLAVLGTVGLGGLALGTPFAAGLSALRNDTAIAWAWGLNSLLSVAGSITTLILSSSLGFTSTAVIAAAAYGAAAIAGARLNTPEA